VWLKPAPKNVVVLEWHDSHGAPLVCICWVGMGGWLTTPANCPPWHDAQPVVIPVWSIFQLVKVTVLVWQFSHGAKVGKWFAGLLMTPSDWLLWQLAHPLVTPK